MRVAIVGGAGFVGHHLALRLRLHNHEVLSADNLFINNLLYLMERRREPWGDEYIQFVNERMDLTHAAGVEFAHVDARDYHTLSRRVGGWQPDCIVQLAAVAHIDRAKKDPHTTFDHSLRTLENALDLAVAINCERFVYFSSSTVYGNFPRPVVFEDDPCNPIGSYGSLKLAGELMVKAYHQDKGLPYTIIRPQALYGPRCVSGRVTQNFIEQACRGEPLTIKGDGSSAHDFTHISDLVSGAVAVIESPKAENETFCLTAGAARSLADLANTVASRIRCTIQHGPPDPDKPSRGTMSGAKAARLLNWIPMHTLESGMNHYIDWYVEKGYAPEERLV